MAELVFNGVLAVLNLIAICASFSIDATEQPLARYWPLSLLVVLFAMLTVKIIGLAKAIPQEEKKQRLAFLKLKDKNIQKLIGAFAAAIVYAVVLQYLGYIVATLLFGFCMTYLLGGRCWWKNLLTSVVITFVLYAVFTWGLRIHPARGVGIFAKFSKWLEYLL